MPSNMEVVIQHKNLGITSFQNNNSEAGKNHVNTSANLPSITGLINKMIVMVTGTKKWRTDNGMGFNLITLWA